MTPITPHCLLLPAYRRRKSYLLTLRRSGMWAGKHACTSPHSHVATDTYPPKGEHQILPKETCTLEQFSEWGHRKSKLPMPSFAARQSSCTDALQNALPLLCMSRAELCQSISLSENHSLSCGFARAAPQSLPSPLDPENSFFRHTALSCRDGIRHTD